MNIKEYLQIKYEVISPTTMTSQEARAFGIPYPLTQGWLKKHGTREIGELTRNKLMNASTKRMMKHKDNTNAQNLTKRAMIAISKMKFNSSNVIAMNNQTSPSKVTITKFEKVEPDFYNSQAWKQVRYKALALYGAQCQCCGATKLNGIVLHVDHIKPRSKFPKLALELSNLQILCEPCNIGKSNLDATDWRDQPETIDDYQVAHLRAIMAE